MRFKRLGTFVDGTTGFVLARAPQVTGSAAIGPISSSTVETTRSGSIRDLVRDDDIAGETRARWRVGECTIFGVGQADRTRSAGDHLGVRKFKLGLLEVSSTADGRLRIVKPMVDCPSTSLTTTGLAATDERFSVTVSGADMSPSLSLTTY